MKQSTLSRGIATLAVCALGVAALGSAKNPVERPNKVQGQYTLTINLSEGTWEHQGFGVSAHAGLFTSYATGHGDAEGNPVGEGVAAAANGDLVFWESPGSSWYVEYTGGTGRFEHATGGWNPVSVTLIDQRENPDGTLAQTYTYTGEGTITY